MMVAPMARRLPCQAAAWAPVQAMARHERCCQQAVLVRKSRCGSVGKKGGTMPLVLTQSRKNVG